jgi:hypothetical protein
MGAFDRILADDMKNFLEMGQVRVEWSFGLGE